MLERIKEAYNRISQVVGPTPIFTSQTLNQMTNCDVFVKCENFQKGGAFKFRGAYNAISLLTDEEKSRGIVTHSSGNHAQAVAIVGKLLNIPTTIVMPENAPKVKIEATKGYGAKVVFSASTIEAREDTCNALIRDHGYTLIHPYDNDNVILGAATASMELLKETDSLDLIIAPVGGGGLLSGTSIYTKLSKKCERVIGAEPVQADDAYRSFKTKKLVRSHTPNTIADGLRTLLSERTFKYISKYVDDIITVDELEITDAMKFLWSRMKLVVEPSGAVPLAVLMKLSNNQLIPPKTRVGIIISGGNVDFNSLQLYFT